MEKRLCKLIDGFWRKEYNGERPFLPASGPEAAKALLGQAGIGALP